MLSVLVFPQLRLAGNFMHRVCLGAGGDSAGCRGRLCRVSAHVPAYGISVGLLWLVAE